MAINKVQYGNTVLLDLTSDTVTADKLMQGYTAHDRTGALITGTATGGGGGSVTQDQDGFIVLPDTGGGGGGNQYAWLGDGAEKVGTVINRVINLKDDTTYDSWTASTTAETIVPQSANPDYTYSANLNDYDYCFVVRGYLEPVYLAGTPMTKTTKRVSQYYVCHLYGYPGSSSTTAVQTDSVTIGIQLSSSSNMYIQYFYDSGGIVTARSATQCGAIYMSTTPSINSTTSSDGTATITVTIPDFYAKCDTNRFTTERKGQVDSANTNYYLTVDLYRVPHGKGLMSYWVSAMCADLNAT